MPSVRDKLLLACFLVLISGAGCSTFFKGTPETIQGYTNVVISVQPDGSLLTNVISQPTITITNLVKGEGFDTVAAVGGIVPLYGEVAVALIGIAGTIYLDWRNRRNKKAVVSTVQGVAQFRAALTASGEKGVSLDDQLTKVLKDAHLQAGIKEYVDEMIKVHVGKKEEPGVTEEVRKLL